MALKRIPERTFSTLDEHYGVVGVADEADPLLLMGKVPGSGSRFEDIVPGLRVRQRGVNSLVITALPRQR